MSTIARVFARRTSASPTDPLAFYGPPQLELFDRLAVDAVHVSVTFAEDLPRADRLAEAWETVARVSIGGPAMGQPGGDFVPGRYLRPGYVITSRGCPNRCSFCQVWRRERGAVRELPITSGWIVQDDNLLACGQRHVAAVFDMLEAQACRPIFSGGLEAARLMGWHVTRLVGLRPKELWFAYDTPEELEPLIAAGRQFRDAGISTGSHVLRCYVLVGFRGDTFDAAADRLWEAIDAGFMPQAMLFDRDHQTDAWRRFQREWANPIIVGHKMGQNEAMAREATA